jgi:DNA-binding NarL/FixJ family response regulator
LHPTQALELERGLVLLLRWMPREIVVPREILALEKRVAQRPVKGKGVSRGQLDGRDSEIVQRAVVNGESVKALAVELGLSERTIQRVLNAA